jgi:hypothetical protein
VHNDGSGVLNVGFAAVVEAASPNPSCIPMQRAGSSKARNAAVVEKRYHAARG